MQHWQPCPSCCEQHQPAAQRSRPWNPLSQAAESSRWLMSPQTSLQPPRSLLGEVRISFCSSVHAGPASTAWPCMQTTCTVVQFWLQGAGHHRHL